MQHVATGYKSLGLLFEVNNDRMLSILIVLAALAAVGWVGVEYAHSVIVHDVVDTPVSFL